MKGYNLEDFYQSINDIFYQFDEGHMSQGLAITMTKRCCEAFLKNHEGWIERDGVAMFVPPKNPDE
jgi:hypothetical protein